MQVIYCDFTVWHASSLHTEHLTSDIVLMTVDLVTATAECYYTLYILPELIGKWFTCSHTEDDLPGEG